LDEAMVEYQKAIALNPRHADAHIGLGAILCDDKRNYQGAILEFRKALALKPKDATAHSFVGNALYNLHRLDEAIAEFQKAILLDPQYANPHNGLGSALRAQGKLDEAITEYQKAIALDPKDAMAYYNLGNVLGSQGKLVETEVACRKAIALKPDYAEAYCILGSALKDQGRFEEARDALRHGHELGSKRSDWRYPSLQLVREAERFVALEKQLAATLAGKESPNNAEVALTLAWMCQQPYKKRHAASARLYADAFAAEPKLATDLNAEYRYNAARSAALAAAGEGEDARLLPDKAAAMFRRWALGWLRDDLTDYSKVAENNPAVKQTIQERLSHWKGDSDLASVRDAQALERLPDNERADWQALWRDVDELLEQAAKKVEPIKGRK
jgi:Flp pilus assembly protein TadD